MSTRKSGIQTYITGAALAVATTVASICYADNPVVQTSFTADPAPMVYDGTVYLYTSHDEDNTPAGMGIFHMRDWRCYTTTDMVNWTDHGVIASLKTFPWAVQNNGAWAPRDYSGQLAGSVG